MPDVFTATVRLLERYFESETSLYPPRPRTRIEDYVASFATYFGAGSRIGEFLDQGPQQNDCRIVGAYRLRAAPSASVHADRPTRSKPSSVAAPRGLGRGSQQHMVAHLRAFMRFAGAKGEAPIGLDTHIDKPRVYREEQLPRALSWEVVVVVVVVVVVQALLRTIDRTTPRGLQDYAIFLLIATYGLRASEIVSLTLDDVEWRARRINRQMLSSTFLDETGRPSFNLLQNYASGAFFVFNVMMLRGRDLTGDSLVVRLNCSSTRFSPRCATRCGTRRRLMHRCRPCFTR